jgi:hypothetical protein
MTTPKRRITNSCVLSKQDSLELLRTWQGPRRIGWFAGWRNRRLFDRRLCGMYSGMNIGGPVSRHKRVGRLMARSYDTWGRRWLHNRVGGLHHNSETTGTDEFPNNRRSRAELSGRVMQHMAVKEPRREFQITAQRSHTQTSVRNEAHWMWLRYNNGRVKKFCRRHKRTVWRGGYGTSNSK